MTNTAFRNVLNYTPLHFKNIKETRQPGSFSLQRSHCEAPLPYTPNGLSTQSTSTGVAYPDHEYEYDSADIPCYISTKRPKPSFRYAPCSTNRYMTDSLSFLSRESDELFRESQ